ncbi:MAG: DUF3108 domain-containing protein [Flavobacteriales bacterium]|nr:DUF3108 domain-containing protein [Flavobacteriales bacterium]
MKKYTLFLIFISSTLFAQPTINDAPFKIGEWLRFELHYGAITAGYSTLEVKKDSTSDMYLVEGKGWTVGMFKWFFKVDDNYKTYLNKETLMPEYFKRYVNEGGYTIRRDIDFDRVIDSAKVYNLETETDTTIAITALSGDMISSFYYARTFSADTLKKNDMLHFDVFMDNEIFKFDLKFLGREKIDTKFGKIKCLKFSPRVQGGRVFKDDESVLLWVTDDRNKIPIRIQSALRVGSIKVDLDAFKGLKYPFKTHVEIK